MESANAPCSKASDASRCISRISSGLAGRSSVAPAATRSEPCPTWGATFRLTPLDWRSPAQSSRVSHVHPALEISSPPRCLRNSSGPPFPVGKGEKLQLPVTWVVTPWYAMLSAPGSSTRLTSEWVCMSMKPGVTTFPAASMTRAASASGSAPIASILPRDTPTSAGYPGPPEPSTTLPPRMRRSNAMLPTPPSSSRGGLYMAQTPGRHTGSWDVHHRGHREHGGRGLWGELKKGYGAEGVEGPQGV